MNFKHYRVLVSSDLYRHTGKLSISVFLKNLFVNPGFKYSFWMRTCALSKANPILRYLLHPFFILQLHHCEYKYGISIPYTTKIGRGFYIGHFGCIVVNEYSSIGDNCNISQGVTIGQTNRGKKIGYPVIGDNVYIGPGAKIIGNVRVGNNVAIGANSVIFKDVPDNAVVVSADQRILSYKGSNRYVNRIDY